MNYKIFLDLDGCITDWNKAFADLGHGKDGYAYQRKHGQKELWSLIKKEGGLKFWSEMSWLNDGHELWDYVKQYNPTILTTPANFQESREGKEIWIKRELGENVPFIFEKDKFKYAQPNYILIDDCEKKINDWRKAGGIGIHHTNVKNTISQLKALLKTTFKEMYFTEEKTWLDQVLKGADKHDVQVNMIDGEPFLVLYHGTSKGNLNKILRSGKFKENTYFAPNEQMAKRYAQMTGMKPVTTIAYVKADGLLYDGNYFYANRDLIFKNGVYQ